jgi:NADH-quinone oxidoreductase subunit M
MIALLNTHLLTALILLPLIGAAVVALLPLSCPKLAWRTALLFAVLELVLSGRLVYPNSGIWHTIQFSERYTWIQDFGAHYFVGVDGLSLFLVLLTTLLTPIIILSTEGGMFHRLHESGWGHKPYLMAFLALEAGIIGSLVSLDLFLFYVFWEVMLIPMFLIIGAWGGQNRIYAAVKFILYTMVGSLLMLIAILVLYFQHYKMTGQYTFNVLELYNTNVPSNLQCWLFAAFFLAFAVKVPLFPVHTWLADAHTEAPTGGSVILAGVLLKLGGYGMLRFAIPFFPQAALGFGPLIMLLSVIGIIYGALVSRVQEDMKRLVAFSSISHLGFAILGVASYNATGIIGGIFVMISHGLTTGALFLMVGMLYDRRHTRMMDDYGGLSSVVPNYSWMLRFVTLASVGLPGLSGFVGEFLVLYGVSQTKGWGQPAALFAAFGMVFSAMYMLYMFQRVMQGPLKHEENRKLQDLTCREYFYMAPLLALILILGLYPRPILDRLEPLASTLAITMETSARPSAPVTPAPTPQK